MTDKHCLYLRHGTIKEQDWNKAIADLGLSPSDATYSWYEPNPESLIGTQVEAPIVCFFKGEPIIPDGVTWSRLMLFYDNGGLTLVADGNRLRYAWWQTKEFPGADEVINPVERNPDPEETSSDDFKALLKTQDKLRKQFGIEASDPFPKDDDDVIEKSPKIVEYYHQGKCIAWTLQEGK